MQLGTTLCSRLFCYNDMLRVNSGEHKVCGFFADINIESI